MFMVPYLYRSQGVQALVSHETPVVAIQERHLVLETSITQRLKWAAGANPSLSATLQQFEETLAENSAILQVIIIILYLPIAQNHSTRIVTQVQLKVSIGGTLEKTLSYLASVITCIIA